MTPTPDDSTTIVLTTDITTYEGCDVSNDIPEPPPDDLTPTLIVVTE